MLVGLILLGPARPPPKSAQTPAELLEQARAKYAALEYGEVLPLIEALLDREDLSLEQRLEAYRYQGSARAIVLGPREAESSFRLLLRTRLEYELPPDTPPKILSAFKKVQTEELSLATALRDVERRKVIAGLSLLGEPRSPAHGGAPLEFSFRLKDPTSAVETVRVPWRREGEKAWSTLALKRTDSGAWEGALSGEVTASERGFVFEYYVETADAVGVLLTRDSALAPARLPVTAGQLQLKAVKPLPRAAFFTSGGVTVALGIAAGVLGIAFQLKQAEYRAQVPPGATVDAALVQRLRAEGNTLATSTNVVLVAGGVALVTTAVMAPLTEFSE